MSASESLWHHVRRLLRREPSRAELLAMWDAGEPVEIVTYQHSSLCALAATGHRGPCSCGGQYG